MTLSEMSDALDALTARNKELEEGIAEQLRTIQALMYGMPEDSTTTPVIRQLARMDCEIEDMKRVLRDVDALIDYQYSGTREAMTYLTQVCDRAREVLK